MLTQAIRLVLVTAALLASLLGPFAATAYAECVGGSSGSSCPR